jgi:flagellar FliL protein
MADTDMNETDNNLSGFDQAQSSSKKKLLLVIAVPLLLLALGGGLYMSGVIPHFGQEKKAVEKVKAGNPDVVAAGPSHFYELPDMIINLAGEKGGRQRFLKLRITLELNNINDEKAIAAVLPRVMDHFQTYLRELRIDDLRGSAGIYRLRQELLDRVRASTDGAGVRDILFEEVLVQ